MEIATELTDENILRLLNTRAGIEILTELVAIDPFSLSPSGRVDFLAALEKQSGWLQALMQSAIVAVAGNEPSKADSMWSGVDDSEREEIAAALRLSSGTAQSRIDIARTLVNYLPKTCAALANGEISAAHASVIARESAEVIGKGLSAAAITEIELKAISHAEFHTPIQVANKVRGTIARLSPEIFEAAAEHARDCRKVTMYSEPDGMATIVALLPAADAQTVMLAIDALARHESEINGSDVSISPLDDERTLDMKRADALTSLAATFLANNVDSYKPHRRPVTVNLTIDLPTLLGLTENPGILAGYGAIPASVARDLAADGKWKRFITDPVNGELLDLGRETYEPPQALIDFLTARDRTCRFPGCRQPARVGDIDHAKSWDTGGETSISNLGVLCRRHHRMKTHGGWELKSRGDGSCTWTSPTGKIYQVPARPINDAA
ncbi:MAG: DUF222 domain-containing protein [Actinobacteria bacterium]|nr:DUF222 domain-containing protein [Actinomycetota bacterium]